MMRLPQTLVALALCGVLSLCTACSDAPGYPKPGSDVSRPDMELDFSCPLQTELRRMPRGQRPRRSGHPPEQSCLSRRCRSRQSSHHNHTRHSRHTHARLRRQLGWHADRQASQRTGPGHRQRMGSPRGFFRGSASIVFRQHARQCHRRPRRLRSCVCALPWHRWRRNETGSKHECTAGINFALHRRPVLSRARQRSESAQHRHRRPSRWNAPDWRSYIPGRALSPPADHRHRRLARNSSHIRN